jgi:hypothetical protein
MTAQNSSSPVSSVDLSPPPGPSLAVAGWLWHRRATWPAAVVSLVFHLVLIVLAALIFIPAGGGEIGREGNEGVFESAVMSEAELSELEAAAWASVEPVVPEQQSLEQEMSDLSSDMKIADAASSAMIDLSDIGSLSGGGELTTGDGLSLGGGGGGSASFFGVEATGTRFVFVIDVSGSMHAGRMQGLRAEITRSIGSLDATAEFMVIPFSSGAWVIGDKREWREASESNKRWIRNQVATLAADGGTEPDKGFDIVFTLRPKPDAIYFMTDGEFPPIVAESIIARNKRFRVPIHSICFGSDSGADEMKRISKESGGRYIFVPDR